MTTFQSLGSHNFLLQYGMATKFSRFVHNLFGFKQLLTEFKYHILVLRYVSSNNMVYFSPHALFLQAQSHICLFIAPWSLVRTKPNSLCRCRHIRRELIPDLKQITPAIPEILAFKKISHFYCFFPFYFLHTCKNKMQTRNQIPFKFGTHKKGYKAHLDTKFGLNTSKLAGL